MKTLTLPNGRYLTGDEIADAVLEYALALSKKQDVGSIDIPFVADGGIIQRVQLIVGWQTGVTLVRSERRAREPMDELVDVDATRSLYAKAKALGVVQAHPFTADELEDIRWPVSASYLD